MINRLLSLATHTLREIPIIILMPHSRCNCRCIMCDIWKANQDKRELSLELIQSHIDQFSKLGVREVVLSGGEALLHSNLWSVCSEFRKRNVKVVLLSTGLLLRKNAEQIVEGLDEVILSLDGSEAVHDRIRNIQNAYTQLSEGVRAVKDVKRSFRITARCVIQRQNHHDFLNIVASAHDLGLDGISFLAADVYTAAFNRAAEWDSGKKNEIALSKADIEVFEEAVVRSFDLLRNDYSSRFIFESPAKMMKIVNYYKAVLGMGEFPGNVCNAPWVSAVIESNGDVMPCFFHEPYGNIYEEDFLSVVNSDHAIRFRKKLNVSKNPICRKCVCTLKLGLMQ